MSTVNRRAFTLVELIVVITILAILATIAFVSFSGYSRSARDTARLNDLGLIAKTIELSRLENGTYPSVENPINISFSGATIWQQGTFGDASRKDAKRISEVPLDPLTLNEYPYAVTEMTGEYQIGAMLEGGITYVSTNQTYAEGELFSFSSSKLKGNYNGKFLTYLENIDSNTKRIYVLGVPSLLSNEITDVTLEDIHTNNSFVFEGGRGVFASYSGSTSPMSWNFSPTITDTGSDVIIYEGTSVELSTGSGKIDLVNNIQTYYAGTAVAESESYSGLGIDTNTDSTGAIELVNVYLGTGVGGLGERTTLVTQTEVTRDSGVLACPIVQKIYPNYSSYAALKSDGSVVTWGNPGHGGDYNSLNSGVTDIHNSTTGYAALKSDGSVVTWGYAAHGGDSSSVSGDINSGVIKIFGNGKSYAALKSDGSVVTWGSATEGGNSSSVSGDINSGVIDISAGITTYAALKNDGSVITWGDATRGGDSSSVSGSLATGVTKIFTNKESYAALKNDGSVITWGDTTRGGDSSSASGSLNSGVTKIYSNIYSYAALKSDGSVITWGDATRGGDSSSASGSLSSDVVEILSNSQSYAALKSDGSVITWGNATHGGDSSSVSGSLNSGVVEIFGNAKSYAALKSDGSVITWGDSNYGGDSSSVFGNISSGVANVFPGGNAYAALKNDGSVITWGSSSSGGDSSSVSGSINSGVVKVFSNGASFAALKSDGSLITWGNSGQGGDNSSVSSSLSSGVVDVYSNLYSYAALKSDGSVITWGDSNSGGDSSSLNFNCDTTVNSSGAFISTWNIPSNNYSFIFPIKTGAGLNYNFTIDWGDGSNVDTVNSETDPDLTHIYAVQGNYTITVNGTIEGFQNNSTSGRGYAANATSSLLTSVTNMGNVGWKNLRGAFAMNDNLVNIDAAGDTSGVTDMMFMFHRATSLTSIPNFDISGTQSLGYMFQYATSFNQDISSWNIENIWNMTYMFNNASSYDQDLSSWDVTGVNTCANFSLGASAGWTIAEQPNFTNCTP